MKLVYGIALMLTAFPMGRLWAQAQQKTEREVRFVSLEEAEKRGKVLQIREKMLFELNAREERNKKWHMLEASIATAPNIPEAEARIRKYIELRRRVLELLDETRDANERQVEVAGLLDTATAAGGLVPQVVEYLKEVRTQLHNLGLQQETARKRLEKTLEGIKTAIMNVPPPKEFTCAAGLKMRLVEAGKKSFYISAEPLREVGEVSLQEAVQELRSISERSGAVYRLPELAELRLLAQFRSIPKTAVWSSTLWEDKSEENMRMYERFGVRLYTVWDPEGNLGRGKLFGELPFAKYSRLSFYAVTPSRTGWQYRWNSIMTAMAENEEKAR